VQAVCNKISDLSLSKLDLVANIDFHSPDENSVSKKLGSILTYPQGFYIDEKNQDLYLLRYTDSLPKKAILEIYSWPKAEYRKTLYLKDTGGVVSEGVVVKDKGKKRFVYIRAKNGMKIYEFFANDDNEIEVSGRSAANVSMAQSFSLFKGKWYIESLGNSSLGLSSRGRYNVYDKNFSELGSVEFDAGIAGYKNSQEMDLFKHQGFLKYEDGFAMSIGGFWRRSEKISEYGTQGIALFDDGGKCREFYIMPADKMADDLERKRVIVDRLENEGIQVLNNGNFILLNVSQIYRGRSGGIVLLKVDLDK